jgi:hypothetical protein
MVEGQILANVSKFLRYARLSEKNTYGAIMSMCLSDNFRTDTYMPSSVHNEFEENNIFLELSIVEENHVEAALGRSLSATYFTIYYSKSSY